ncbi:MAG TPA: hypothetical protein VN704_00975 [Verrucomicrobiae bacterium]|nr:hypothetical protein [Verrucomicrobiae bacterium]
MGVSQSKTSVDVVNQSIITAITNNVNSCSSSLNQNQQVSLSGVGIFNWFSQSASLNVQCLQQATMTNDLSMQIAQQIQQDAQAQAVALLPSYSGSQNVTNLANKITTSVTTNIIQQCAAGALQNQQISTSGFQVGNQVTQTLNLFSSCMQKALNNNNIAQGIVQNVSQTASSTTSNPLDFLGNMFSYVVIGIIGFIILIIILAYLFLGGGGGSSSETQTIYVPTPQAPLPVTNLA